eukprot:3017098-Prymnesium_polylepis.2
MWEGLEKKTLETLTAMLKDAKYGCGKWMVFVPPSEVDEIWAAVVEALWEGKLGHSAKVSGAGDDPTKSHVICVYVDPFWEVTARRVQTRPLSLKWGLPHGLLQPSLPPPALPRVRPAPAPAASWAGRSLPPAPL